MPKISHKGEIIPASAIRKLVPFADAAKERGVKVYHLNIGQPDILTPKGALDVLRNASMPVVEYTNSAGNLTYRKKLAEYYQKNRINVTHEDIIVTTGGSEALQFAFQICLNDGEEILIPEPYYTNYNSFAIQSNVVVKTIHSSIEDGFALPPIEEFEKAITSKTKAIMVCNPNNPTGYLYSQKEIEVLGLLAKKYDLYLIADEVYREFCYDGMQHHSVMELKGLEDNVILVDSVSKRYSACGARIGCIVSKNKKVMSAAMRMAQARLCPPYFGQIFSEAAIDTPQSYFEEVNKEYDLRRKVMVELVNKIEGCYCPTPKGAFYTMIQMPIDDSDKFCQWLLEDFSYQGATVMLAPATGFYSTPEKGKKQARIAYCLCVEDIKAAVKCLEEGLKVYPGREK
ncbi:MAG: pyridoxal phosphate-dependent aminotransferase [Bacteroidales bacterium]|jgi:aspartate aminotransferase|nr:pyridoxal phosphate-dependent aminotransferase [Bacteroidales bacterium]